MNIFFLSLLIGALTIPMDKVPGTKPTDVLMSEDKENADAEVPMAKAKAPIAKAHEPKPDLSHLSMLEKFKHDPKYFVSQMSKANPRTLRTILGLLNDMLTTSEDRELHLHGNWDTAQDELDVANADVIAAEGVLSGAVQDQTDADTTLATANADLIAKRAVQTGAQTEKDDAQTSYDDAIGSLDDEQEVLQKVINILTELLTNQPSEQVCTNWKIGAACGGAVIEDIAVSEAECVAECKSRSNCHCISWGVNTNALCRLETGPDATHRGQGAEDSGWKACEEPDFKVDSGNYRVDGCQGRMFGGSIGINLPDARGYHLYSESSGEVFAFAGIEGPYLKVAYFRADNGQYVHSKYKAHSGTAWSYDKVTSDDVLDVVNNGNDNNCSHNGGNKNGYCMREITGCPRSFAEQ